MQLQVDDTAHLSNLTLRFDRCVVAVPPNPHPTQARTCSRARTHPRVHTGCVAMCVRVCRPAAARAAPPADGAAPPPPLTADLHQLAPPSRSLERERKEEKEKAASTPVACTVYAMRTKHHARSFPENGVLGI